MAKCTRCRGFAFGGIDARAFAMLPRHPARPRPRPRPLHLCPTAGFHSHARSYPHRPHLNSQFQPHLHLQPHLHPQPHHLQPHPGSRPQSLTRPSSPFHVVSRLLSTFGRSRVEAGSEASRDAEAARGAKARAWYLPVEGEGTSSSADPTSGDHPVPGSSSDSIPGDHPIPASSDSTPGDHPAPASPSDSNSNSSSTSSSATGASGQPPRARRSPVFTTFDPLRTTSSAAATPAAPLPANAPPALAPLHAFLTAHDDAVAVLEPGSVRFLHTPSSAAVQAERDTVDAGAVGDGAGPWQEWVVLLTVKGVGKNVIGRAERAVRVWLHNNPIGEPPRLTPQRPKTPRTQEGTDWSIIALPEKNVAIHLFTAEGRDHWNLEDLWGQSPPKTAFTGWPKDDPYSGFGWRR